MAVVEFQDPLALLRDMDRRARSSASGLPQQEEPRDQWTGIGFRVAGQDLVAPLDEVVEILTMGELSLTRVPGTKPWVNGIANVRGSLLPVVDLLGFLSGGHTPMTGRTRVLVVDHQGVYVGLLVEAVLGLKHFFEDDRVAEPPGVSSAMASYVTSGFRDREASWPVFSTFKLAEAPLFMQVAI